MIGKPLISAALLAAFAAFGPTTQAHVVWKGNFETGDLSQWNVHQGNRFELVPASGLPRGDVRAVETSVERNDWNNGGERNELVHFVHEPEGSEYYYRWQTRFPTDYQSDPTWQVFTQWHTKVDGGVPPVQFFLNGETMNFAIEDPQRVLWTTPLVRGVWHDFILNVKFSDNRNTGFVKLWHDGAVVVEKTFGRTRALDYLKQGLYRNASMSTTGVVYHAGMIQGTTMEDVAAPDCNAAMWSGDFSTGDLTQWTRTQVAAPDRIALEAAPTPAPRGLPAARVTVQPGDLVSNGNRAQLVHLQNAYEGSEHLYRWHAYFPGDYPSVGESQALLTLNRRDDVALPPVVLRTLGEELQLSFNDAVVWRQALQRARWQTFTLYVKYSDDPSTGRVALYHDDRLVVPPQAGATYAEDYLKLGLNRSGNLPMPSTIYVAGMTEACSLFGVGGDRIFADGFQ
ncbi:heparin lyase I family protein [Dokdonella sp.]|uniref:heparin lyase I family protein n=1 Tax=Dokdonella sp. TaxID=2291710 RepID=UPI001B221B1C|nr:heparin lyase I family protein [Dokdonella sp.]MBO9662943.1 polysaccharide lyase [Dokdonella sp.]